jgi:hypothetical protein
VQKLSREEDFSDLSEEDLSLSEEDLSQELPAQQVSGPQNQSVFGSAENNAVTAAVVSAAVQEVAATAAIEAQQQQQQQGLIQSPQNQQTDTCSITPTKHHLAAHEAALGAVPELQIPQPLPQTPMMGDDDDDDRDSLRGIQSPHPRVHRNLVTGDPVTGVHEGDDDDDEIQSPLQWVIASENTELLRTQIQEKIEQGGGKLSVKTRRITPRGDKLVVEESPWFILVVLLNACRTYNYSPRIAAPRLVKDQAATVMWDLMRIGNASSKTAVKNGIVLCSTSH